MAAWHYNQFHPSTFEQSDEGAFGGFPDICSATGNKPGSAHYDLIHWGKWLVDPRNAGFNGGWRFDYAKGFRPSFCAEFRAGTGTGAASPFGVGEFWDTNIASLDAWVKSSGETSVFDFPGYYTLRDVFDNTNGLGDIANLLNPNRVYAAHNPSRAVTFCANHDTDEIKNNKMLAYAFILTYQGYPCIFWKDYFNAGLAAPGGDSNGGINRLVWVRGALAGGKPVIQPLKTDNSNLLIYGTASGKLRAPGYIVAINDNPFSAMGDVVDTRDRFLCGKTLKCYAWYSYSPGSIARPAPTRCSRAGFVRIQAPPRGYAIYAPVGY
jgi:alpha-amylase